LEAQFNPTKAVELSRLEKLADSVSSGYPKKQNVDTQEIRFGVNNSQQPFQNFQSVRSGFQVSNELGNRFLKFEINAFSVSFQGGHYPPWPSIRDLFLRFYSEYLEASRQHEISRIGLRIVNRLELPIHESTDLSNFIHTEIELPKYPNFPNDVSFFSTEVVVPFDQKYGCRVRQQTEASRHDAATGEEYLGFILDIDVYKDALLEASDIDQLSPIFEKLREMKNLAFFGTLTERTVKRYE